MKTLSAIFLFAFSVNVSAQQGEAFAKVKAQAVSNLDKRIGFLTELKSCISGAADKTAMKACRDAHKAKRATLKKENESWREGMKAERKEKREARKKQ